MNQRPFLIKFSDASVNKTMGRVLIFRIFPFAMNEIIIAWSDAASIILKHLRKNVNYLSKQTSICNSIFSLMVRAIDFGFRNGKYFFGLFRKICLVFFEVLIVWNRAIFEQLVSSVSLCRTIHCLPWLLYLLRFVGEERAVFIVSYL